MYARIRDSVATFTGFYYDTQVRNEKEKGFKKGYFAYMNAMISLFRKQMEYR